MVRLPPLAPDMVSLFLTAISPPVRMMVLPLRAESNAMVSPLTAAATVDRRDPDPLSLMLVTVRVAPGATEAKRHTATSGRKRILLIKLFKKQLRRCHDNPFHEYLYPYLTQGEWIILLDMRSVTRTASNAHGRPPPSPNFASP